MAKELTRGGIRTPGARLLGFVPEARLAALKPALDAVAGPPVSVHRGAGIVALVQPEPPAPLLGRGRAELLTRLHTVQRRLEIACQAGALLAMDPAAACCPAGAVADMLAPSWPALAAALAGHGGRQQWDIVLRWTPEAALAPRRAEIAAAGPDRDRLGEAVATVLRDTRARREAALIATLRPAVLAFAAVGAAAAETEVAVTVLLPTQGEAAVEAALAKLPAEYAAGATLDMRGPLPPLSFAAVRVIKIDAMALAHAWARLDLQARTDPADLHRHWRQRAFALHPDRNTAGSATALSQATEAYHLLRSLMREAATGEATLAELTRHAGHRLIVPPPETEEETSLSLAASLTAAAPAPELRAVP